MFGLRRKAAPNITRDWPSDGPWYDETIRNIERLRGRWMSHNPDAANLLAHAIGVADICAWTNATICTSAVLRLYRRVGASGAPRQRMHAPIASKSIQGKRMQRGRYGHKIAEFTQGGAEMQEVVSHPVLDLLSKPNPLFPGEQLAMQRWYYQWVTGNAYDKIEFSGSVPSAMWPLYSQYVQIRVDDEDNIAYVYGRSETDRGVYSANEVVHYKLRPNPHSPLYGLGALAGVLPYSDLIIDTLAHNVNLAKNGMRPDALMIHPEGTTSEQVDEFDRRFTSRFRGVTGRAKILHIVGAGDYKPITYPEKELLSREKQQDAEKIVRESFGHNEAMNDPGGQTYNGALVGFSDQFLGGWIEPALQMDAAQLNARLLPLFGLDPDEYALAYDPLATKDEAKEYEILRLDVHGGIMTTNEARVERGLEKIDDPMADKLLFNGVPLGGVQSDPFGGLLGSFGGSRPAGGEQTPPEQTEEPEPSSPGGAVAEGEPEPSAPKAFDIKSIRETCESPLWRPCECCKGTKATDAASEALKAALQRFQGTVHELAFDVLTDMQDDALQALAAGRTPDLTDRIAQVAPQFQDVFKDIFEYGVANVMQNRNDIILGGGGIPDEAFNIQPERALRALERYSFDLAGEIAETTVRMAETAVRNGVEQGLSIQKIADEMSDFPEYRANAIARTEISRAMNTGAREAMVEVGVQKHKVLTAPGVRASHAAIAAQGVKPIDEPFVKAGDTFAGETFPKTIFVPPFGVQCRCGIVGVYEESDGE